MSADLFLVGFATLIPAAMIIFALTSDSSSKRSFGANRPAKEDRQEKP